MAPNARDTTRLIRRRASVSTTPRPTSPGGSDVAPDVDLAGVLTRLTSRLEHFEAALAVERGRIEHPMPFEQPGRHSERISSSVTALVAELQEILTLLRRLRETDEIYGQRPAAAPQPFRQGRGPT